MLPNEIWNADYPGHTPTTIKLQSTSIAGTTGASSFPVCVDQQNPDIQNRRLWNTWIIMHNQHWNSMWGGQRQKEIWDLMVKTGNYLDSVCFA